METRVRIRSALHRAILDPEARAIRQQLNDLDFTVNDVRTETHYLLTINAAPPQALQKAEMMAKTLLCNPLLHTWSIEIAPDLTASKTTD